MKLKGVKKLDKGISQMVRKYICEDITCKFSPIFCISDDTLYYSLFIDEDCNRDWSKWLKKTYGTRYSRDFSIFALSILHEIGHYFTLDDFDETEAFAGKEELIIDLDADTEAQQTEKRFSYWNLPVEKAATDWAIDFYNSHKKEMKIFCKDCEAFITSFYNKNLTV